MSADRKEEEYKTEAKPEQASNNMFNFDVSAPVATEVKVDA